MTRDILRPNAEHDLSNDADTDVFAALWAVAHFPRVPDDAPSELKELAIELEDPKRVYVIHKASRRHHFQLLVERYILQVRYGCRSKTCNTRTCFSYRKRIANGAPVRRYNATSARTLAVYMASQDNPEHGLCHNTSADRAAPFVGTVREAAGTISPLKGRLDDPLSASTEEITQKTITAYKKDLRVVGSNVTVKSRSGGKFVEEVSESLKEESPDILDEPPKTDYRSFVQNVFGTVAFKMVEWLTPRNLRLLAAAEAASLEPTVREGEVPQVEDVSVHSKIVNAAKNSTPVAKNQSALLDTHASLQGTYASDENFDLGPSKSSSSCVANGEKANSPVPVSISEPRPAPRRKSSHVRTSSDPVEYQPQKNSVNNSVKGPEIGSDVAYFPHSKLHPKQKAHTQALITSPVMQMEDTAAKTKTKSSKAKIMTANPSKLSKVEESKVSVVSVPSQEHLHATREHHEKGLKVDSGRSHKTTSLPQSLTHLPIEVVELICDILEEDDTLEKHMLFPQKLPNHLKRTTGNRAMLSRSCRATGHHDHTKALKLQWQAFVEQSLFDVLGRPASLLQSFHTDNGHLFDTHTIWYLMLRLTRIAPSMVFGSLWTATSGLFKPPHVLEATGDWAKVSSAGTYNAVSLSNRDAAEIISICLHGLIAAVPLVDDARQIMNMSRIRSYGLAMLGKDSSALEPVTLCLRYEDAFTNELALRLARRLFAAIPTRRSFNELFEHQRNGKGIHTGEPDVLDIVLDTVRISDSGAMSILKFSKEERDLHETRVPTLMLDWARTVMIQEWHGAAEVPKDGPFGGALATMTAIYKKRKTLLLGDIHFRTEYFSERLDPVSTPREWINFEPTKRTMHLLDHPYLFSPSTLVNYFRAINFSRMNHSYETAKATIGLMNTAMAANHNLMADRVRRDGLLNRLRTATSSFMVLEISRTDVLKDTFNAIWRREERELMRPLKIRLGEEGGEEGLDSGGVQQEFFRLAIAEALNPDYGTFTIDDRTKMTWFQPGSAEPLWKFELIGTIISLAVYNGSTLPVTFPKAFYRKLLGDEVTELHHIADGWPDLASGLTHLLEWDEKDGQVEDVFARTYEFSVEQFGQPVSREMRGSASWPQFSDSQPSSSNPNDAPLVTNDNRNNYVSDYIRWLTDLSIRPQFEAFKSGFFACIDQRSVKLFDSDILQSVVEGIQDIDISELRRTTRYVGYETSDKTIRDFWSIVKKYDMDQKRRLLEFVTASDRVPVGGMRNLQFTLQKNGVGGEHLPTSYTCYGILLLPEYASKETLKEKLAMALENSKGFGFA